MKKNNAVLLANITNFNKGGILENFGIVTIGLGLTTLVIGSYIKNASINKNVIIGNSTVKQEFMSIIDSMK